MENHEGEERTVRAARNQAMFREVNERLEGLAEAFQYVSETANFACECADASCIALMDMRLDEYELVRSHPNQFAVLPGHIYSDVEKVVAEHENYVIVSKLGVGAEIAENTYPRT